MRIRTNPLVGLAALPVVLAVGCDTPPPPDSLPPVTAASADVVTDQGRGTYDWRLNLRRDVLRPDETDEGR